MRIYQTLLVFLYTSLISGSLIAQCTNPIILNQIPSPISSTYDLAWDGTALWIGGQTDSIYQFSPVDGSIISAIPTTFTRNYGLTYDGTDLWVCDPAANTIRRIATADGSVLQSFSGPGNPSTPSTYPMGLAWDGTNLWNNDPRANVAAPTEDSTFKMNPSDGSVISQYDAPALYPSGLAFGGGYLWQLDNNLDVYYQIDPTTFTVVNTFCAPGGNFPNGLTFDGSSLWLSNNDVDSIYQIDVSAVTSISAEAPTLDLITIFPNPSSDIVNIQLNLPGSSLIELRITDVQGKLIAELYNGFLTKGETRFSWDGIGNETSRVSAGIYYATLQYGDQKIVSKLLIE